MNADTIVRPVTSADYADWRPLWDHYNAFYGRKGAAALSEDVTAATWERFLDPDAPLAALVAERTARIVGIAHYLFHPSTVHSNDVCYLQDLFTADDVRGEGIGSALISAVCERARAAGSSRVYWHTHESNARAISLYRKMAELPGFILFLRAP